MSFSFDKNNLKLTKNSNFVKKRVNSWFRNDEFWDIKQTQMREKMLMSIDSTHLIIWELSQSMNVCTIVVKQMIFMPTII